MSRHTSPNKRRIEAAYPVLIKIKVPPNGLGNLTSGIAVWIKDNMGDRCKNQSTTALGCHATALHFCTLDDAQTFLDAFPMLELADGTGSLRFDTPRSL